MFKRWQRVINLPSYKLGVSRILKSQTISFLSLKEIFCWHFHTKATLKWIAICDWVLRVLIVIACQWAQACAWSMRSVVSCLCLVVSVVCVPAPRQSTKDTAGATLGRKKDRSRSKSPFRSFRWKKSSPKSPTQTSASDDEGNLERAAGNEHNPSSFESLLIVSLGIVYLNTFFTFVIMSHLWLLCLTSKVMRSIRIPK